MQPFGSFQHYSENNIHYGHGIKKSSTYNVTEMRGSFSRLQVRQICLWKGGGGV